MINVATRCYNCAKPLGDGRPDRKYCSEPCKREYRQTSKRNFPPPPYVGDYDLLPDNLKALFTPGDPEQCWVSSKRGPNGYAINTSVKMYKANAYRLIYLMMVGPIPEGLDLHHTCHNGVGGCVNWHHLKPMSRRDNLGESVKSFIGEKVNQTHCLNGHPFDYIEPQTGKRACLTCKKDRTNKRGRLPKPIFCTYCRGELEQHARNYRRPYCDTCKESFARPVRNDGPERNGG